MFLEILDELMKNRGISRATLARESGIPYTTIDTWYKGKYDNIRLSTLKKLSAYFNVSLDYLMQEAPAKESQGLDEDESELLTLYRSVRAISPDDAEIIIQYARCVDRIAGVGLSAARKQAELASDFYDALRQERRG